MSGLTKKDLKDLVKEALKECLSDNAVLTALISECIKTSIVTILKEITVVEKNKTIYKEETTPVVKPQISKTKHSPILEENKSIFNKDNLRQMMEEELGLNIPNVDVKPATKSVADMEDTLEDDPMILKALGII